MNVLILTDYRNQLWLKTDYKEQSVDVAFLATCFRELGCDVCTEQFADIDLRAKHYVGTLVVYQSSEDPDLRYQSYVEDQLLALHLAGAILVPPFPFFRAHHNKVFMEMLRDLSPLAEIKLPRAHGFGTFEEYAQRKLPATASSVFKLSEGAQSKYVRLMTSERERNRIPRQMTRSIDWYYWLVDWIKPFLKTKYPHYRRKSHHRRKFIVQDFIADLTGDYKVLVYGDECYVLERKTRDHDFRASGSGKFSFPEECPVDLLTFARKVFLSFDVPFISMDIARSNGKCFLIEFQFVSFGTYTLEKSPHYYCWRQEEGDWVKVVTKSCLEQKVASAVVSYAQRTPDTSVSFHGSDAGVGRPVFRST